VTGKELILYILQNNLENDVVVKNGLLIAVLSDEEIAVMFNVGIATVQAWRKYGGANSE
jgi:transposase